MSSVRIKDIKQECELEAVQKELLELLRKKNTSGKQEESFESDEQDERPVIQTAENPGAEVCVLQPLHVQADDDTPEQEAEPTPAEGNPTDPVVPGESRDPEHVWCICWHGAVRLSGS